MIELDFSEFERAARRMGDAGQAKFATSRALNDAVKVTRQHLIDQTWPQHVTVRKSGFMRAALRMEFSSKTDLSVAIKDTLGRAHLKLHATGGTKQGRGRLAIPSVNVRRGASGVVSSQRPGALQRKVVRGDKIFQAVGGKRSRKLRLMYVLATAARIKKDVPFYSEFAATLRMAMRREFPRRLAQAMKSRK